MMIAATDKELNMKIDSLVNSYRQILSLDQEK